MPVAVRTRLRRINWHTARLSLSVSSSLLLWPIILALGDPPGRNVQAAWATTLLTGVAVWVVAVKRDYSTALGVWGALVVGVLLGRLTGPVPDAFLAVVVAVLIGYATVLHWSAWLLVVLGGFAAALLPQVDFWSCTIGFGSGVIVGHAVAVASRLLGEPITALRGTEVAGIVAFFGAYAMIGVYFGVLYWAASLALDGAAFAEAPIHFSETLYESMLVLITGDFPTLRPTHGVTKVLHVVEGSAGVAWIAVYLALLILRFQPKGRQ